MKYQKLRWIIIGAVIVLLAGAGFALRFLPTKIAQSPVAKTAINNPVWPADAIEPAPYPAAEGKVVLPEITTPGFFVDNDFNISFHYPKDWVYSRDDRADILSVHFINADGAEMMQFLMPGPDTGFEETANIKEIKLTAADGSLIGGQFMRACLVDTCDKTRGSFSAFANWRNALFYVDASEAQGTPAEAAHMRQFEDVLRSLNIVNNNQKNSADSATLFGEIKSLNKAGEKIEAVIQLDEWVKGQDDQEQAALVDGQCTLQQIESDTCLNNAFYLRKTDKTITLQVDNNGDIETYAREPRGGMLASPKTGNIYMEGISLEKFVEWYEQQTYLKETPYYFSTNNGVIVAIKEQYVP